MSASSIISVVVTVGGWPSADGRRAVCPEAAAASAEPLEPTHDKHTHNQQQNRTFQVGFVSTHHTPDSTSLASSSAASVRRRRSLGDTAPRTTVTVGHAIRFGRGQRVRKRRKCKEGQRRRQNCITQHTTVGLDFICRVLRTRDSSSLTRGWTASGSTRLIRFTITTSLVAISGRQARFSSCSCAHIITCCGQPVTPD
jgi:hypothetical protein